MADEISELEALLKDIKSRVEKEQKANYGWPYFFAGASFATALIAVILTFTWQGRFESRQDALNDILEIRIDKLRRRTVTLEDEKGIIPPDYLKIVGEDDGQRRD